MPTKYNGRPGRAARHFAWGCLFLVAASRAGAQWALGPWDDATVLPRGVLRAGIPLWWTRANERFAKTGSRVESLGSDFTFPSLDQNAFPAIGTLQAPLSTLSGIAAPTLSLGELQTDFEESSYLAPIALEYGLTSRLTLTTLIPYIKTRAEVFPKPNASGPGGTLGANPAFSLTGARDRNTVVFTELSAAAALLQSELARCLNSTATNCSAINADRAAATALATATAAAANAVAAVYGTAAVGTAPAAPGSPFVPVGSSALQSAIDNRLTILSDQLESLLGAAPGGEWIATRPVGAPPFAYGDFQRVLTDSAFGIVGRPFTDIERSHVGDIEVGAKLLLLDTFGPIGREPRVGNAARLAVGALVRLGTAQRDTPEDFADIGTGDRQHDVEVRAALDLKRGRRWWMSGIARYGVQLADRLTMRVPSVRTIGSADILEPFPPASHQIDVDRDLGDYMEFEVAPRFTPNINLSFSGNYRFRMKQDDRFTSTECASVDPTVCSALSILGNDTDQQEQRVGWAITYSTVRGYTQRRAPWPLDISFLHTQVLAGRGVRKEFASAVMVRWYRHLGREAARPVRR